MRSMHGINRLSNESFRCDTCEVDHVLEDVKHDWKCPTCREYIQVLAANADGSERLVIVRKRASELKVGDLLLMPGNLDGKSYQVLGVTPIKGRLGIGLRGWGQYKIDADEPVNCRVGAW